MRLLTLTSALRIAAQHPALLAWYVENRFRATRAAVERSRRPELSPGPQYVTLKPTLRCNLRCEFCRFVANGDVFGGRDWMDAEDWERVIDEVAPYRPYLCLTGGEPLMYPELPRLLARIRACGLRCVLTTNGTLLERRAAELAAAPPDMLILSIDGPEAVHDSVRGKQGAFSRALAGVEALRAKAGRRMPLLVLNTALTEATWQSAQDMAAVARRFGAEVLNFQHFWFLTREMVNRHNSHWGDCFPLNYERIGGTSTMVEDPDALWELVRRLNDGSLGIPVMVYPELNREQIHRYYGEPEAFTHSGTPTCAWTSTDVLPNGDVSPCFELTCGNLLEQSFGEIWNGDAFRAHRRRLTDAGPYPVCARCCAFFRRD